MVRQSSVDEYELEPELAGYVPNEGMPRRRRMLLAMRVVVIVGIACLILPGIFTTFSVAARTANTACTAWVKYEAPAATGESARFEIFGAGGMGWECYATGLIGGDEHVASLGLIPVSPKLSPVPKPPTPS
jgi:hypothetical protein